MNKASVENLKISSNLPENTQRLREGKEARNVPVLLAVDPGTDKVGWAVVAYDLRVIEQGIAYVSEFHRVVRRVIAERHPEVMVMGGGTAAPLILKVLNDLQIDLPVRIGDEKGTSEEARKRYFAENPPTGFWRFVPIGLQLPPRSVDDYAAVIIGERYIKANKLNDFGDDSIKC